MIKWHAPVLSSAVALLGIACSPASEPAGPTGGTGPTATGGTSSQGGGLATGGASATGGNVATGGFATGGLVSTGGVSTGGVSTGGVSTGGVSTGGSLPTTGGSPSTGGTSGPGGKSSMGGASSGGTAGGTAGGGKSTGGQGGASSTGGTAAGGTSSTGAKPSPGCSKGTARPANGVVTVANNHIYTFPTTYDGTKPFPLLMGFHAAGNPIDQIRTLTNGSDFEKNYVRAFGKSAGNEWVYNTDKAKVIAIYDELMADYCIDMSRVFATGHSSGAQMIYQILTKSADAPHFNFKAVAPVAASNYGAVVSPIPVMYIQGAKDNVRNSDGADVVAQFTKVNKCMTSKMPFTGAPSCSSGGTSVNPGCVIYDGCVQPTIWCSHNDPAYSGTSHGWPCFATKAMYDFFTGLP